MAFYDMFSMIIKHCVRLEESNQCHYISIDIFSGNLWIWLILSNGFDHNDRLFDPILKPMSGRNDWFQCSIIQVNLKIPLKVCNQIIPRSIAIHTWFPQGTHRTWWWGILCELSCHHQTHQQRRTLSEECKENVTTHKTLDRIYC